MADSATRITCEYASRDDGGFAFPCLEQPRLQRRRIAGADDQAVERRFAGFHDPVVRDLSAQHDEDRAVRQLVLATKLVETAPDGQR
jgi:hypothetical protein